MYSLKVLRRVGLSRKHENMLVTFEDHSGDFISGPSCKEPRSIPHPNPHYLAIHAAIAGVLHMSGAGQFFDEVLNENKDKVHPIRCRLDLERKMEEVALRDSVAAMFQSVQVSWLLLVPFRCYEEPGLQWNQWTVLSLAHYTKVHRITQVEIFQNGNRTRLERVLIVEDQHFRRRFRFARIKDRRDRIYWAANIRRLRRKATQGTSQNKGEHGLPPARVLLPKVLLIVLMFLDSPKRHLSNSEAGEHECWKRQPSSVNLFRAEAKMEQGSREWTA